MFELYHASLLPNHTYDQYTALQHTVFAPGSRECEGVGFTDGAAAIDVDVRAKAQREDKYPIQLLDSGVSFRCVESESAVPADKQRILALIEKGPPRHPDYKSKTDEFDAIVRGLVAASALRRVLEEGGERCDAFLSAVYRGRVGKIGVSIKRMFEPATILKVLNPDVCKELQLSAVSALTLPATLGKLHALTVLDLSHSHHVTHLPDGVGLLEKLEILNLKDCRRLTELPDSFGQLRMLSTLNMCRCKGLVSLPDLSGLTKLECIQFEPQPLGIDHLDPFGGIKQGLVYAYAVGPHVLSRTEETTYEATDGGKSVHTKGIYTWPLAVAWWEQERKYIDMDMIKEMMSSEKKEDNEDEGAPAVEVLEGAETRSKAQVGEP